MNQKEIKELIEFLIEKDITEFELERGDVKLRVKRGAETHVVAAPVMQAAPIITSAPVAAPAPSASSASKAPAPVAAPAAPPADDADLHYVKSPIVGTYYESPSPGSPPFIKVGDRVKEGQVLCIVEAMKLMNEIEADASGEIVKMLVSNGAPVEYGMPLFAIRK
ncbi:biotin carboxyl carrier protein [Candidatus Koribacter versatilis Ellin345]|uniref:Biotin carboxyl carrier protein of acetyl-CoA carboxylase n=1 Tax=Koribacter versatilis (strain Ellin345) TaxID=204669 RepID=Q1ILG1_KORVE|nr:acetyl-CoA carboxylase biotin carboxyl carrier protein [Candidatus Koribacter versatilis]ABF42289.1 biotin carboxyl carrier protein [Candidatus Koribacter versatilis Ellin345]